MNVNELIYLSFFGLTGLVIGSFLNVVAIRLLKQESIVFPHSHCVHCQHRLKVWDLIPVFSYLWLRGTCRYCKHSISPAYVYGELSTGLLFVLAAWHFDWNAELGIQLLLFSILVVVVHTDLKAAIIPNRIVYFAIAVMGILRLFVNTLPMWDYYAAFIIAGGILYILAILSKGGMGGGDIKLFALIGLFLGIQLVLLSLFLSSLFGLIFGLGLRIKERKVQHRRFIPFGPFIAAGVIVASFYGHELIDWYVALLF